jgi:hypothetical protein
VKCDVCSRDFNNSEELKRHQEEVHPMGERDERDERSMPDDSENPEVKREMTESEPAEMPAPVEGRTR